LKSDKNTRQGGLSLPFKIFSIRKNQRSNH